jgi:hypothetical protein
MRVECLAICDAATESQGKLNILGAFANIWARKMPVKHPHCSIAVRVRFFDGEEGDHPIVLTFADADGQSVIPPLNGNLGVRIQGTAGSAVANLILNLNNLELKSYGEFTIDLMIDGEHVASLPLYVQEAPRGPGGPELGGNPPISPSEDPTTI